MLHNFPIILLRKKIIAENTIEMSFSVSSEDFGFKAGQYVSIEVPALVDAPVPDRYHDFSIASSPSNQKEISIAFRISSSVYKTALLDIPIGGTVNMSGPKGVLLLPENTMNSLIFIAGGIGITPFLSMVRHATEIHSSQKMTLLYCNSKKETIAYHDELALLAKQNPNFVFREYLGIPNKELFAAHILETPSEASWYIVGAPAMVENVEQLLLSSGILDTQIRVEEFSGYLSR